MNRFWLFYCLRIIEHTLSQECEQNTEDRSGKGETGRDQMEAPSPHSCAGGVLRDVDYRRDKVDPLNIRTG